MLKAVALIILFFTAPDVSNAQNLTGTWQGTSGGEYWRMVLIQIGDSCYGYTYDSGPGFCKADFVAAYIARENKFNGQATRFISSSFDHSLITTTLSYEETNGNEYLTGAVRHKSLALKILSLGKGYAGRLKKISREVDSTDFIIATAHRLKKNSAAGITIETLAMGSFIGSSSSLQIKVPDEKTTAKETPALAITPVPKEAVEQKEIPEKNVAVIPAVPTQSATDSIITIKQSRVTNIVETISTAADSVKIILYDDGEVDGDIVTVFDNGIIVANKLLLTKEPWSMLLPLTKTGSKHTIELVAENEGSIPPNTAYMLIIAGDVRTELKTSSDTKTNGAVIILKSN